MKLKPFNDFDALISSLVTQNPVSNEVYRILKRIRKKADLLIKKYEKAEELRKKEC